MFPSTWAIHTSLKVIALNQGLGQKNSLRTALHSKAENFLGAPEGELSASE